MKWLRLYDELVDDPKVQRLSDALFRANINLWCITSQNNGKLPPIEDIAFKLHLPVAKAKKIVATLLSLGLLDKDEDGNVFPHNWNSRQFKSDGPSTSRVKRFRDRNKDGPSNGDETFHETTMKRPQSQRQNQKQIQRSEQHTPENETAREPATKSLISPEAHTLAEELWQVAGFSKETLPPGWCGGAMKIQQFLNDGCPAEVIRLAVEGVLKRKCPVNFAYFEPAIAHAFADHKRPLPQVVAGNPKPIEVRNGYRAPSWVELATESIQSRQPADEAETRPNFETSGGPVIELDALPDGK